MNAKLTLPLTGAWFVTLVGAYYIGTQKNVPVSKTEINQRASDISRSALRSSATISGSSSSVDSPRATTNKQFASRSISNNQTQKLADISEISRLTDPLERSRKMLNFIENLSPDQFESVVAELRATGMAGERINEYTMLLRAWGQIDPQAALAYTTENIDGDFASQEVLAAWASNNPNKALLWARENYQGEDANPYLVGVVKGLVDSNPTLATQILQELPYSEERGEALRELIPYIAEMGTDGASQWLNTLQDTRLINGASAFMAEHLAQQSPEQAAEWTQTLPQGEGRQRAIDQVMEAWVSKDSESARTWLDTLPYEDQLSAGPEFVNTLARADANSAADWLDEQTSAPNYQDLLKEFAQGATRSDPVLALNYGNELENDSDRSRTVGRALWTLYRQDKESAREWIRGNDLPERVQRYVNRMLEE